MSKDEQPNLLSIQFKLDQVQHSQAKIDRNVDDIKVRLFDPDEGLYARINQLQRWAELHEAEDKSAREKVNQSFDIISKELKDTFDAVSPLREEYVERKGRKRWTDKVWGFILATLISLVLSTIWIQLGFGKNEAEEKPPTQERKSLQESIGKALDYGYNPTPTHVSPPKKERHKTPHEEK